VGAKRPLTGAMRLRGSKAIVTGCSRGLGAIVAETMWCEGADLLLVARSEAALRDIRNRLAGSAMGKQQVHVFAADLSDPTAPAMAERRHPGEQRRDRRTDRHAGGQ